MELDKIAPAFVAAQAELGGVEKDSKNPAFKSKYASLEAVIEAAKPVLIKHQLAFLQMPGALTDQGLSVTTMILHDSGQHISSTLTVPLAKRDPQGAGSAITYACRYSLMAMLGMPPVDDDGEAAMDRPPPRQEAKLAPRPAENVSLPAIEGGTESQTAAIQMIVEALLTHKTYNSLAAWWRQNQPNIKASLPSDYYEAEIVERHMKPRLARYREAA